MPVALVAVAVLIAQWFWVSRHQHMFQPFKVERIQCWYCGHTGVVHEPEDNPELSTCPVCYGVGGRQVRRFDREDKLCPACEGMGRLEDAAAGWRTCKRCDGRGLIRDAPPWHGAAVMEGGESPSGAAPGNTEDDLHVR
jgi:hypothetical protein